MTNENAALPRYELHALAGYEPEIGRTLDMLNETRRRLLRHIEGISQEVLDWQGPDGQDNSIGTLLYHIAGVEMGWLFAEVKEQTEMPADIVAELPYEAFTDGRMTPVLGVSLDEHLARLQRFRDILFGGFQGMSIAEWRRLRVEPEDGDYECTPEWVVFHLIEHEAVHTGHVGAMKARALRALAG